MIRETRTPFVATVDPRFTRCWALALRSVRNGALSEVIVSSLRASQEGARLPSSVFEYAASTVIACTLDLRDRKVYALLSKWFAK